LKRLSWRYDTIIMYTIIIILFVTHMRFGRVLVNVWLWFSQVCHPVRRLLLRRRRPLIRRPRRWTSLPRTKVSSRCQPRSSCRNRAKRWTWAKRGRRTTTTARTRTAATVRTTSTTAADANRCRQRRNASKWNGLRRRSAVFPATTKRPRPRRRATVARRRRNRRPPPPTTSRTDRTRRATRHRSTRTWSRWTSTRRL